MLLTLILIALSAGIFCARLNIALVTLLSALALAPAVVALFLPTLDAGIALISGIQLVVALQGGYFWGHVLQVRGQSTLPRG